MKKDVEARRSDFADAFDATVGVAFKLALAYTGDHSLAVAHVASAYLAVWQTWTDTMDVDGTRLHVLIAVRRACLDAQQQ